MNPGRILIGSLAVLLGITFIPSGVSAHHRWGKYHWARSNNPFTLQVGDNVSSGWDGALGGAISDWSASSVLNLNAAAGGTTPSTCAPTLGRIEVCNGAYGSNGWLGIAQIWIGSGSHITQATTKVNDTYFNTAKYNTPAWRQFVMCQEVGHDFGLDHQNEAFSNANLGSCMDYTDDPDGTLKGQLSNLHPNQHDFDMLESIYSHLDGSGGGRTGGAGNPAVPPQAAGNSRAEWGQLVAQNGRLAKYVLDLGNGNLVFTFVIWA